MTKTEVIASIGTSDWAQVKTSGVSFKKVRAAGKPEKRD
jgi:hypothetical protein